MATYAIGDVQGCYRGLCKLLDKIQYNENSDILWFCGDLVNRGPESLETLRFIKSLGERAVVILGNHDLHLLALYHTDSVVPETDTLHAVLNCDDRDDLMAWLQACPLLHYDRDLRKLMVHAGIHPDWSLQQAISYATEVEQMLAGPEHGEFFANMYGDQPDYWQDELTGMERLRCITNVLTRMRFLKPGGRIDVKAKYGPEQHPELTPWYQLNRRATDGFDIVFGHWSTLEVGAYGHHYAIDGGYVWGGKFVALQIDTTKPSWTSIDCQ